LRGRFSRSSVETRNISPAPSVSFLTVSGQLNGETYASALSKIYTFGPTFRAENSNTQLTRNGQERFLAKEIFAEIDFALIVARQVFKIQRASLFP
jgi:aspartyl/asparaginyl-tRNA synthetase